MNPEKTYLEQLPRIERISAFIARKNYLNADETAEFVQVVRVRLFEDDYAILRKFQGRSELSTYLNTVIGHIFSQRRVEEWGKWRPSAEAKRLGTKAILLERLLTRDGHSLDEAVKIMTMREGPGCTVAEIEAIYLRLPNRNPRPVLISEEVIPDVVAVESDAEDRLESRDREDNARRVAAVLDEATDGFDPEERLMLRMRFQDDCKIPEVAAVLGMDPKKVYKRLEKLMGRLRRVLHSSGIARADVDKLCGRPSEEIHLGIFQRGENLSGSPSHPAGEGVRGGEGGLP